MLLNILTIMASIAGILGAYQFIIFLRRYYERPLVRIGILPTEEIKEGILSLDDIGKISGPDEMLFHDHIFAPCIHGKDDHCKIMIESTKSIRTYFRKLDNKYEFPIILYNKGRSTLTEYKLTISFRELVNKGNKLFDAEKTQVQLIDVATETAEIDGLYANPETFLNKDCIKRIPSKKIRDSYEVIGLNAHFVTLRGELSSGIYEMIYIQLEIPKDVKWLALYYEFDARGEIPKAIRYGQIIKIEG